MKILFNPVHRILEHEASLINLDSIRIQFRHAYGHYCALRNFIAQTPKADRRPVSDFMLRQLNESRYRLAQLAMLGYQLNWSLASFDLWMRKTVAQASNASPDMAADFLLGSYLYPTASVTSRDQKRTPSPIEAILTTTENLAIIERIASVARPYATGLLFSGAHAWGPFYDTRGKLPQILVDQGVPQRETRLCSDIDCVAVFNSANDMLGMLRALRSNELVTDSDLRCYDAFLRLFSEETVDIFSVSMRHSGIEINCDFLLHRVLKSATCLDWPHRDGHRYYFRALKTSLPPNDHQKGGYLLYDSTFPKGQRFDRFETSPQPIVLPENNSVRHIARKPIMGYATGENGSLVSIDVFGFYLLVAPIVAIDKNGSLSRNIERMQSKVEALLNRKPPQYIVREERMPPRVRVNIGRYLAGLPY